MAQLIGSFCISRQWACCSTFKYLASAFCSNCSTLQKPSTFSSSTCIDLLRGDWCMLYGGYFIYVMCNSSISYTLTSACCGYIGCSKSQQQRSRSIPPRPNTLTLSCTLPCQTLREFSWQKYILWKWGISCILVWLVSMTLLDFLQ